MPFKNAFHCIIRQQSNKSETENDNVALIDIQYLKSIYHLPSSNTINHRFVLFANIIPTKVCSLMYVKAWKAELTKLL